MLIRDFDQIDLFPDSPNQYCRLPWHIQKHVIEVFINNKGI